MSASLHPLVSEVSQRQFKTLKLIYLVLTILLMAILVVTLVLGSPMDSSSMGGLLWLEALLAGLSLAMLGLLIPLARKRLLSTERLAKATEQELSSAGLPEGIDPRIGRQAVYLTRYTAGCVITWGLCTAVGMYGLVARMMGAGALETGGFFAVATFVLVLLPPDRCKLNSALESFQS
jgi:hypothetical protein